MDILLLLIENIIPLYIIIAVGYIVGRWMDVNLPSMATVAIYVLAPVVNFGAMVNLSFDMNYIALPLSTFVASAIIGLITYNIAHYVWRDKTANLIGMGSVTGNTGYFGLPLVLALFGPEWAGVYLFMNMGMFLNEIGLGYYFGARGNADVKTAVLKVIKLPVIHALWLGLLANALGFELSESMTRYWNYSTGAWVIIGMMLIGVALSKQKKLELDWKLMGWMFTPKFILWPLFGGLFIAVDILFFNNYDTTIYQLFVVFTCVPLAGNIVAFASNLDLHPERAATAVLISTLLGIITIPGALLLFQLLS